VGETKIKISLYHFHRDGTFGRDLYYTATDGRMKHIQIERISPKYLDEFLASEVRGKVDIIFTGKKGKVFTHEK